MKIADERKTKSCGKLRSQTWTENLNGKLVRIVIILKPLICLTFDKGARAYTDDSIVHGKHT